MRGGRVWGALPLRPSHSHPARWRPGCPAHPRTLTYCARPAPCAGPAGPSLEDPLAALTEILAAAAKARLAAQQETQALTKRAAAHYADADAAHLEELLAAADATAAAAVADEAQQKAAADARLAATNADAARFKELMAAAAADAARLDELMAAADATLAAAVATLDTAEGDMARLDEQKAEDAATQARLQQQRDEGAADAARLMEPLAQADAADTARLELLAQTAVDEARLGRQHLFQLAAAGKVVAVAALLAACALAFMAGVAAAAVLRGGPGSA
jgi:hypothetical protein